jgi:hypothetical protein
VLEGEAASAGQILDEVRDRPLPLGREPVMESDSGGLVLDQKPGRTGGEAVDLFARPGKARRRRDRNPAAVGVEQFGPVRSRKHRRAAAEMAAQIVDGAAADDGEASLEPLREPVEQRLQAARHGDRRRSVGQLDQSAVEVEKQGRGSESRQRRRLGFGHGLRWQYGSRIATLLIVFRAEAALELTVSLERYLVRNG